MDQKFPLARDRLMRDTQRLSGPAVTSMGAKCCRALLGSDINPLVSASRRHVRALVRLELLEDAQDDRHRPLRLGPRDVAPDDLHIEPEGLG